MRKLEALLQKFAERFAEVFEDEIRERKVGELIITLALLEGIGIWLAIVSNSYFFLSITTYFWVEIIAICVDKIFFKKLNNYLLKTPKATALIFWIIFIGSIILSHCYFIGFIISVILEIMSIDYIKNIDKNEQQKEDFLK